MRRPRAGSSTKSSAAPAGKAHHALATSKQSATRIGKKHGIFRCSMIRTPCLSSPLLLLASCNWPLTTKPGHAAAVPTGRQRHVRLEPLGMREVLPRPTWRSSTPIAFSRRRHSLVLHTHSGAARVAGPRWLPHFRRRGVGVSIIRRFPERPTGTPSSHVTLVSRGPASRRDLRRVAVFALRLMGTSTCVRLTLGSPSGRLRAMKTVDALAIAAGSPGLAHGPTITFRPSADESRIIVVRELTPRMTANRHAPAVAGPCSWDCSSHVSRRGPIPRDWWTYDDSSHCLERSP